MYLVHVAEPLSLHPLPAFRAFLPESLIGFISAYVDVFAGEKLRYFGQYLVKEAEGLFIADAEGVINPSVKPATRIYMILAFHTSQFWIGGNGGKTMPPHINPGHNGHETCFCITNHFPDQIGRASCRERVCQYV